MDGAGRRTARRLGMLLAFSLLVCVIMAAGASASTKVYWAGYGGDNIGVVNLNGSGENSSFIAGVQDPCSSVAVTRTYVYWDNYSDDAIGRAKLNGTDVKQTWLTGVDTDCSGVAVYGNYLYWANKEGNAIGRATLSGKHVNNTYINGTDTACGVVGEAGNLYWADDTGGEIGRVSIAGKHLDGSFITGGDEPCYAMAATSKYLFWANYGYNAIARATLGGRHVNQALVADDDACGVAVVGNEMYFDSYGDGFIGKARLDGSDEDDSFVSDATHSCGLGAGPYSTAAKLSSSKKVTETGKTVTLTATVTPLPDGGTAEFTAGGKAIKGCVKVTVSIVTGKASCHAKFKTKSDLKLAVKYSGDAVYIPSKSKTVKETVK